MSLTLAEVLPKTPEQFPDSSEVMPEDLRTESFRPASGRILKALGDISRTEESDLPEGWIKLRKTKPSDENMSYLSIVNPEIRVNVGASVYEGYNENPIVHGRVRVLGEDEEIKIGKIGGSEVVDIEGTFVVGVGFRGVTGNGNPYFHRSGIDCEPELQILAIDLENYKSGKNHGGYPDPYSATYAFFDKSPVGDQKLVEITEATADFLENIPVGEPTP